uniref:HtrA serine peptidase 3a n=1 Tax=Gadus morhua TaxID=8049 RepID=A0A8C5BZ41_GADMO
MFVLPVEVITEFYIFICSSFHYLVFRKYGNSGGPLVNLDGEVIGINTLKVTAGISFAIPADRIKRFLTESQNKNKAKRRILGIQMLTLTEALKAELKFSNPDFPDISGGVLVHQVVPGSPAAASGIQIGDVIVQLNGRPLLTADGLHAALLGDKPLLLEVRRERDELLFSIQPQLILH